MVRLLASLTLVAAFAAPPLARVAQKAAPARPAARPAPAAITLNPATAAALETLPGIGQKVAARSVEHRSQLTLWKQP